MAAKVVYSEGKSLLPLSLVLFAASCGALATSLSLHTNAAGALFAGALLGFVAALTLYSLYRYNAVELRPDFLRVGKEKVAIGELDKTYGVRTDEALTDDERSALNVGFSSQVGNIKILGKSWGLPLGAKWVLLRLENGELLAVSTRKRERLSLALSEVVSGGGRIRTSVG